MYRTIILPVVLYG